MFICSIKLPLFNPTFWIWIRNKEVQLCPRTQFIYEGSWKYVYLKDREHLDLMTNHSVLLLTRVCCFFFVRLQCRFTCLTAEIFSFMTVTKQSTICKLPDLLCISTDVLFWERTNSMQNIQCLQAKWIVARILETLPEFSCWTGYLAERGEPGIERNKVLSSFLLIWHLGVLKWPEALQTGSAHGHRAVL